MTSSALLSESMTKPLKTSPKTTRWNDLIFHLVHPPLVSPDSVKASEYNSWICLLSLMFQATPSLPGNHRGPNLGLHQAFRVKTSIHFLRLAPDEQVLNRPLWHHCSFSQFLGHSVERFTPVSFFQHLLYKAGSGRFYLLLENTVSVPPCLTPPLLFYIFGSFFSRVFEYLW